MNCPFCKEKLKDEIILENELCFFIMTRDPVLKESGMIIPKDHKETAFELTKEEFIATYELLQEAKDYLQSKYAPQGYTLGWNVYPVGGQTVMHAHLHIIPRFMDEPLAFQGLRHHLKQSHNKRRE